ncbi:MAG: TIGR00341 family protein [Nitrospiraceae bacterium]
MAFRLIEIILPDSQVTRASQALEEQAVLGVWQDKLVGNQTLLRVLVEQEHSGAVMDRVEGVLTGSDGFRIIVFPVEASLPRPQSGPPVTTAEADTTKKEALTKISREELYAGISATTKLSWTYLTLVVLSSIVAAIGLLRDNVAIIIGAMVIAPLLGPNIALSLATTLADFSLARRALKTGAIAAITAFACSALGGFLLHVDPTSPEIAARTSVGLGDVVLALAAGSAGALAFTTGVPGSLIGVMVAVALLPPLVTVGLLAGGGHWTMALGALLLLGTNLICINLSGVVTFLAQGVRPRTWWQAEQAKRSTQAAIAVWALLLALLTAFIVLSQQR